MLKRNISQLPYPYTNELKNNLEKLTLWNQGNLDSIIPLSKLEHLTTLNIWEQTKIIDGKISFLNQMPNLKKIDIRKYTHYH